MVGKILGRIVKERLEVIASQSHRVDSGRDVAVWTWSLLLDSS